MKCRIPLFDTPVSFILLALTITAYSSCGEKENRITDIQNKHVKYAVDKFCMGVDLSYVNQIEDHGGVYRDSGQVRDPYRIFSSHGANTVRVRLWHNPTWTKDVYGASGTQLYNDLYDVEKTIRKAKEKGMAVNLDFHFSDTWADPGKQSPPAAWKNITSLTVLKDSVYQYTKRTLTYLNKKGLLPEMVQAGNEINCGMMTTGTLSNFPGLNVCSGKWAEQGEIINSAIKAVREVSAGTSIKTQVILHVADPKNLEWWFDNMIASGKVTDFEIIGVSYYHIWHTAVAFDNLPSLFKKIKDKYNKKIMIVETAYPWSASNADGYGNIFNSQSPLQNFAYTPQGQYDFLVKLTQNIINAGGSGIVCWEPAWITSQMKDLWGTGSAWDNCTFFDFQGNANKAIDFMNFQYVFP